MVRADGGCQIVTAYTVRTGGLSRYPSTAALLEHSRSCLARKSDWVWKVPQKWAFISEDRSGPGKNSTDILALCGLQHIHLKVLVWLERCQQNHDTSPDTQPTAERKAPPYFQGHKSCVLHLFDFSIHSKQVYSSPLLIVGSGSLAS